MSNTQYLGTNAGFYYTVSGATTWVTFPLAVPLREGHTGVRFNQYVSDSLDFTAHQVLTVASTGNTGIWEYIGTLRYNDDQVDVTRFIHQAAIQSGSTTYPLRYTTGLTTGTSSGGMGPGADAWLIEPMGLVETQMDGQRASFGDLQITLRFRLVDAGLSFSTNSGARWF